jgi:hypothetical protein
MFEQITDIHCFIWQSHIIFKVMNILDFAIILSAVKPDDEITGATADFTAGGIRTPPEITVADAAKNLRLDID